MKLIVLLAIFGFFIGAIYGWREGASTNSKNGECIYLSYIGGLLGFLLLPSVFIVTALIIHGVVFLFT